MAILTRGEPPVPKAKYRHLMPDDAVTWTRFLEAGPRGMTEVWYDLHVGTAVKLPEGMAEFMQRVSDAVTRKRIDVVARVGSGFWVIEVKPICGFEAMGQALVYRDLFAREYAGAAAVVPVVVCELVEVDVLDTSDDLGVLIFTSDGILR